MRRLPPLAQLRAFEAVARHLSFKEASVELAVTPTALSHQIRMLENFCGQSLFIRRPRPVRLTEAGIRLFPVLRQGLDAFEAAIVSASTEEKEQAVAAGFAGIAFGQLEIGISPIRPDAAGPLRSSLSDGGG